jgi:hypothetical protein
MPNSVGRLAVRLSVRAASHADLQRALHGDELATGQASVHASVQAWLHASPLEPVHASEPGLAPVPGQGRSQAPTRVDEQPELHGAVPETG